MGQGHGASIRAIKRARPLNRPSLGKSYPPTDQYYRGRLVEAGTFGDKVVLRSTPVLFSAYFQAVSGLASGSCVPRRPMHHRLPCRSQPEKLPLGMTLRQQPLRGTHPVSSLPRSPRSGVWIVSAGRTGGVLSRRDLPPVHGIALSAHKVLHRLVYSDCPRFYIFELRRVFPGVRQDRTPLSQSDLNDSEWGAPEKSLRRVRIQP